MLRATIPQLVSGYIYAARIVWLSEPEQGRQADGPHGADDTNPHTWLLGARRRVRARIRALMELHQGPFTKYGIVLSSETEGTRRIGTSRPTRWVTLPLVISAARASALILRSSAIRCPVLMGTGSALAGRDVGGIVRHGEPGRRL